LVQMQRVEFFRRDERAPPHCALSSRDPLINSFSNDLGKGTASRAAEKLRFGQVSGRARVHSCRNSLKMCPRFSACGRLFAHSTSFSAASSAVPPEPAKYAALATAGSISQKSTRTLNQTFSRSCRQSRCPGKHRSSLAPRLPQPAPPFSDRPPSRGDRPCW